MDSDTIIPILLYYKIYRHTSCDPAVSRIMGPTPLSDNLGRPSPLSALW